VTPGTPTRSRRRRRVALGLALSLVAGATGTVAAVSGSAPEAVSGATREALPAPPTPGVAVPRPRSLAEAAGTRWAPIRAATFARRGPGRRARPIVRLGRSTPEGTVNNVEILGRAVRSRRGGLWIRVRLPVLPNNTTGWVDRRALGGYGVVHTRLVVDRARLEATLLRDGRPVFRVPVGVGRTAWPTPAGSFYIRNRLTSYRSPMYGPLAFGTSARSAVLTDWPAGGFVGIHGTDRPELLPGRVSHGCVRMRNRDIVRLGRLMPVGTPLTIR
jgi:lipoprotein-anchoring transpeptidase ErfK/SrfK